MLTTTQDPIGPLVTPADLAAFRGGPFGEAVTNAAAQSVRTECGWHIAPSTKQTIAVRTGGADAILLPSLHVTAVNSVTDRNGTPVDGWDVWSNGILERPGGFPDAVQITFTHGFETCPKDLLGIIAERAASQASGRIKSEAAGGVSISMESGYDPATMAALAKYLIEGGP